jgi:Mor family transcriptional regulator
MAQFKLSSAQVPEDLYWLYELVGLERFLKIIDTAGGEFLYFPKRSTLERDLRREAILREFDGTNLRQLARKYGLSERHVRSILQKEGPHKTS